MPYLPAATGEIDKIKFEKGAENDYKDVRKNVGENERFFVSKFLDYRVHVKRYERVRDAEQKNFNI